MINPQTVHASQTYPEAGRVPLLLWILVPGCLLLGSCGRPQEENIILITVDTLRADHLGCYGYPIDTSPTIDRLANEGVRFDTAIAQSATTPVSCASQLTGLYPYQHGLRAMHGHNKNRLREDVDTLAGKLGQLGYKTAAFVSAFPAGSYYGLSRNFEHFDESFLRTRGPASISPAGQVGTGRSQRTASETNERMLPWLHDHAAEKFFLWVHYFDPHDTVFTPPQPMIDKFLRARPEENREEFLRSVYDAEIFYTDLQIKALLEELDRLSLRDKTILVFTADHGEGLGDHGWWAHGTLHQEQIRIPLILNGPGIPRGTVVKEMVQHVDLFPTLMEIAGSGTSKNAHSVGRSLLLPARGETASWTKRPAYSESHNILTVSEDEQERKKAELFSVIDWPMKLIHYPRDPSLDELYDLASDPKEQTNLIRSHSTVAMRLLDDLKKREAMDGFKADSSTLPADAYEYLKSLGYVQ